jgi:hypothetical protein
VWLRAVRLSVRVLGSGMEGERHAEERAVHEDVTVLGEQARLERAIVILLELAEPAPEPALRQGIRTCDVVQRRAGEEDALGAVENERAERAGRRERERGRGSTVERERKVEYCGAGEGEKCDVMSDGVRWVGYMSPAVGMDILRRC